MDGQKGQTVQLQTQSEAVW